MEKQSMAPRGSGNAKILNKKMINFFIDSDSHARIKIEAAKKGISMTLFMTIAIREYVNKVMYENSR